MLQIAAGGYHTCLININNSASCFGANSNGQLGRGTVGNILTTPQPLYGSYEWRELSIGFAFTCGISVNGSIYCWGINSNQALGSVGADALVPRLVPGGPWGGVASGYSSSSSNSTVSDGKTIDSNVNLQLSPSLLPSSSSNNNSSSSESSSSSNVGAIVGGVVGGVAAAVLLAATVALVMKRQRSKLHDSEKDDKLGFVGVPLSKYSRNQRTSGTFPNDPFNHSNSTADNNNTTTTHMDGPATPVLRSATPGSITLESANSSENLKSIDEKELLLGNKIGQGSFGVVYRALWHHTPVAVKRLLEKESDASFSGELGSGHLDESGALAVFEALQKEAGMMASLRHPNIVQFLGICSDPPCIITEYCDRGSLVDVLKKARMNTDAAKMLTFKRRLEMLNDAAKGMLYLHSNKPAPILHRDLKSPNLLVGKYWNVKVADFNLSRVLSETSSRSAVTSAFANNPRWLAPEIVSGAAYSRQSDVFAFGVVMWEMITFEIPWSGVDDWHIVGSLLRGDRLPIPSYDELHGPGPPSQECYSLYVDLIERCWAQEVEERPLFDKVATDINAMGKLLR